MIEVSLDIAREKNTGLERAYAVEECHCPRGYKGLSCEDCDFGYTRVEEGLYFGLCEPCKCNGHSNECDPETGECKVQIQLHFIITYNNFCCKSRTAVTTPGESSANCAWMDMKEIRRAIAYHHVDKNFAAAVTKARYRMNVSVVDADAR